jgi:Flp pilus assembly protein TadG
MKLHRNESGQMLIMTAVELTLLIGFLALAADVGVLFHSKRHMQIAADAAATAGALNLYNRSIGATGVTDTTAADSAAAANGYTNGQDGVTVTVNGGDTGNALTTPYHTGNSYLEVIISKPDPLYFFKFFTGNGTASVAARAVAGDPAISSGCFWTNYLYIKGNSSISGPNGLQGCGIYVNSTSSSAIYNQDSSTTINTAFLDTPGGGAKFPTTPTAVSPNTGVDPQPYQDLPTPDPTATGGPCTTGTGGNTYTASSYPDAAGDQMNPVSYNFTNAAGMQTNINVVCFSANNVTIGNGSVLPELPMGNGVFIFENGVTISGYVKFGDVPQQGVKSSTVGALIYNWSGQVQYRSNSYINAYDMTAGVYNGVALYQPASNSNALNLQFGNSGASGITTACDFTGATANAGLDGYIVAPSATVNLQDEGGTVAVTGIIANEIYNNSPLVSCNYNSVNQATTPLRNIALVE